MEMSYNIEDYDDYGLPKFINDETFCTYRVYAQFDNDLDNYDKVGGEETYERLLTKVENDEWRTTYEIAKLVHKCMNVYSFLYDYRKYGVLNGYYEEVAYINDNEVDVKVDNDMIIINDHQYVVGYWKENGGTAAIVKDFVKTLENQG